MYPGFLIKIIALKHLLNLLLDAQVGIIKHYKGCLGTFKGASHVTTFNLICRIVPFGYKKCGAGYYSGFMISIFLRVRNEFTLGLENGGYRG
jgi:hypothetical protein